MQQGLNDPRHPGPGVALLCERARADSPSPAKPRDLNRALLINETLARSGFLGEQPLGAHVYTGNGIAWEIIGIVEDVRQGGLTQPAGHQIFASLEQSGVTDAVFGRVSPYFAVSADGAPAALVPAIRDTLREVDPRAAPDRIATMDDILSNSILRPRFYAAMMMLFAVTAGTLAVAGIYGAIAFAISRRLRELGIRLALGASKWQLLVVVIGDVLLVAALGIGAGLAGGAAVTRYMEHLLFDLTPFDPVVFAAVPLVFGLVVAGAALLSARPALTLAPMNVLRRE